MVLKDLKLKSEALNSLKLPVTVKAGFVGTITLKVLFYTSVIAWLSCGLLLHFSLNLFYYGLLTFSVLCMCCFVLYLSSL